MNKLILFAAIILTSCGKQPIKQKPFIIVKKLLNKGYTDYYYDCPNCLDYVHFEDSTGKYNVGDTIN